ncbi:MAG: PIG-L family deacetylase [Anaerolineae bacterium]|nr:PIG-L family deacetylase [Anaerolineae bacterium]
MFSKWPAAKHIFLAPHLDDAVLSCGGTIATLACKGESTAVLTVFAASLPANSTLSTFANQLHVDWKASAGQHAGFTDPPAVRRREDINALRSLSPTVQVIHLDGLDCIYRVHPETGRAFYHNDDELFGTVHPADPAVVALQSVPPFPAGSRLYAPLGVGNHVDHQIVRDAVDGWNLPSGVVRYYEDYPYAHDRAAVEAALAAWSANHDSELRQELAVLDEDAVETKIAAIAKYTSQIGTFWESLDAMTSALRTHNARVGGESFWM